MMKFSSLISLLVVLLIHQRGFAQSATWQIEGRIMEKNNLPIPFANVFINNSSIGSSTNDDGYFRLLIPNRMTKVELVVSFIGYESVKRVFQKQRKAIKIRHLFYPIRYN